MPASIEKSLKLVVCLVDTAIQVEDSSRNVNTGNALALPRHSIKMTQITDTSHNIDPRLVLDEKNCGFAGDD